MTSEEFFKHIYFVLDDFQSKNYSPESFYVRNQLAKASPARLAAAFAVLTGGVETLIDCYDSESVIIDKGELRHVSKSDGLMNPDPIAARIKSEFIENNGGQQ